MKFLQEVLKGVRRLDDEPSDTDTEDTSASDDQAEGDDDLSLDVGDEEDTPDDGEDDQSGAGFTGTPDGGAPFDAPASGSVQQDGDAEEGGGLDLDGDDGEDDHEDLDGIAGDATQDPDHQGLIRNVKGAHLVYKRDTDDGTFEELWIYNITTLRDELNIKKAILAGTDIPINKTVSPDGNQSYDIWSSGNAEMIVIRGLPN